MIDLLFALTFAVLFALTLRSRIVSRFMSFFGTLFLTFVVICMWGFGAAIAGTLGGGGGSLMSLLPETFGGIVLTAVLIFGIGVVIASIVMRAPCWTIRRLVDEKGHGRAPDAVLIWLARRAGMGKKVSKRATIARKAYGIEEKKSARKRMPTRVAANDNREGWQGMLPVGFVEMKRAA